MLERLVLDLNRKISTLQEPIATTIASAFYMAVTNYTGTKRRKMVDYALKPVVLTEPFRKRIDTNIDKISKLDDLEMLK